MYDNETNDYFIIGRIAYGKRFYSGYFKRLIKNMCDYVRAVNPSANPQTMNDLQHLFTHTTHEYSLVNPMITSADRTYIDEHHFENPEASCICGHWIVRRYYIKTLNTDTHLCNYVEIGSCCVTKFGVASWDEIIKRSEALDKALRLGTKKRCCKCDKIFTKKKMVEDQCIGCSKKRFCEDCDCEIGVVDDKYSWQTQCYDCYRGVPSTTLDHCVL